MRHAASCRRGGRAKSKLKQQDVAGSILMDRQNLKLAELQLLFKAGSPLFMFPSYNFTAIPAALCSAGIWREVNLLIQCGCSSETPALSSVPSVKCVVHGTLQDPVFPGTAEALAAEAAAAAAAAAAYEAAPAAPGDHTSFGPNMRAACDLCDLSVLLWPLMMLMACLVRSVRRSLRQRCLMCHRPPFTAQPRLGACT